MPESYDKSLLSYVMCVYKNGWNSHEINSKTLPDVDNNVFAWRAIVILNNVLQRAGGPVVVTSSITRTVQPIQALVRQDSEPTKLSSLQGWEIGTRIVHDKLISYNPRGFSAQLSQDSRVHRLDQRWTTFVTKNGNSSCTNRSHNAKVRRLLWLVETETNRMQEVLGWRCDTCDVGSCNNSDGYSINENNSNGTNNKSNNETIAK